MDPPQLQYQLLLLSPPTLPPYHKGLSSPPTAWALAVPSARDVTVPHLPAFLSACLLPPGVYQVSISSNLLRPIPTTLPPC